MRIITALIHVTDNDKAKDFIDKLFSAAQDESLGFSVVALSNDDEFKRMELIEEAIDGERDDLISEIINKHNVHLVESIDELAGY